MRDKAADLGHHTAEDRKVRRPSCIGSGRHQNIALRDEMRLRLEVRDDACRALDDALTNRCALELEQGVGQPHRLKLAGVAELQDWLALRVERRVETVPSDCPVECDCTENLVLSEVGCLPFSDKDPTAF